MTRPSTPRHAVVIGGSLAGLLAAAVLAEHAAVTIIDADASRPARHRGADSTGPGTSTCSDRAGRAPSRRQCPAAERAVAGLDHAGRAR